MRCAAKTRPSPGYRASAAVATYSRVLAAEMYGEHRPYGYVFGGSGGAYRTIACFEMETDVWDGAVPYIHGTMQSLPSMHSVHAHAFRVLAGKFDQIVDALEPGGSGDMYAGLNEEERAALAEATRLGFPPGAWFDVERIKLQYVTVWGGLFDHFVTWDPTYLDDFWTVPGYLGANPTQSLLDARLQHKTRITELILPPRARELGLPIPMALRGIDVDDVPVAYVLEDVPDADIAGAMLRFTSGRCRRPPRVDLGTAWRPLLDRYRPGGVRAPPQGRGRRRGARRQRAVPRLPDLPPASGALDRRVARVGPVPRRGQARLPAATAAARAALRAQQRRGQMNGRFAGKMIVVQSLFDEIAYPQQADWYRRRVSSVLGDRADDQYRVWFTDHAMHQDPAVMPQVDITPHRSTRIINYRGVLEQALRDLAAWVERGVAPPPSTNYENLDGQILLPATAAERRGIQPVVHLTANGDERADVVVGEPVAFEALVEVPPGAGTIVAGEWDFEGTGDFPVAEPFTNEDVSYTSMTITREYAFSAPGTYFPALRVTAQRLGQADNPHGRVMNLGRVRVVVA